MGAGRVPASEAVPEGVAFEVERFEWTSDGRLEVTGRWYGLRGHRFVRPALTVDAGDDRRRMLADLEHKPWAAEDGEEWIAAFPWEGEPVELAGAELAVAPTLVVELPLPGHPDRRRKAAPPADPGPRPARRLPAAKKAAPKAPAPADKPTPPADPGPRPARRRPAAKKAAPKAPAPADEPTPPAAPADEPTPPAAPAAPQGAAFESAEVAAVRHLEAELADARATIRRLIVELDEAQERLRAEAQRPPPEAELDHDAVVSERDEAVRSGAAAMQERDEALDARATANWERDAARAERDAAKVERDRAAAELQAALERSKRAERERDAAVAQRDLAVDARAALVRERESATAAPDPDAPTVRRRAISREAMRQESVFLLWARRFAALVVLLALAAVVYALVHSAV